VAAAGSVAGCSGNESTDSATESPTSSSPTTTTSETEDQPSVEEFLEETSNFDGIEDMTESDTVSVDVGVEANGAYYGFAPPAIRIDRGTTVRWTWTGQGGIHNVATRHGADFESEQTSEEDYTFEHTFDETGTVLYVCVPHEGLGMKGAIVVE
jgi:halocyanin-like protein